MMRPKIIFILLSLLFLIYSLSIYLKPLSIPNNLVFNKHKAAQGRLVWQNYNCQACHQLYSLGGYLGPDLTNCYSATNKGESLIKSIVKSGTKQMPAFNLSENEIGELLEFLKSTDASGLADPRKHRINNFGMFE